MDNSALDRFIDMQEGFDAEIEELEKEKALVLKKKRKIESNLNSNSEGFSVDNFFFEIQRMNSCDFNFFFVKKFISFNFTFLLFYKNIFYNYILKSNEIKNLNLFFFFNNSNVFENYLIFLKKKNFFFFNDIGLDIFSLIKGYRGKNSFFFDSKKRASKLFFNSFDKNSKKKLNFYNYFFKKKNILKKKNNNKKIKSKFVNCKKFFKSKKLEILRYLKDIYFKKRVNKRYVSIFIKKLKKKSTLAISYSLSTNFLNVLSIFFFFLNLNYIKFLLKKKYFYINFKPIRVKKNSIKFGSFFSCLFFSQIFDFFFFFKTKIDNYLEILSRKIKRPRFSKLRLLKGARNKNLNLIHYLNNFNFINSKLIEADYLTLSFFFFGNGSTKLVSNFGFNIFLHRLLLFK